VLTRQRYAFLANYRQPSRRPVTQISQFCIGIALHCRQLRASA
jgi:hypothetical protein